jgi:hypothetical protein
VVLLVGLCLLAIGVLGRRRFVGRLSRAKRPWDQ